MTLIYVKIVTAKLSLEEFVRILFAFFPLTKNIIFSITSSITYHHSFNNKLPVL